MRATDLSVARFASSMADLLLGGRDSRLLGVRDGESVPPFRPRSLESAILMRDVDLRALGPDVGLEIELPERLVEAGAEWDSGAADGVTANDLLLLDPCDGHLAGIAPVPRVDPGGDELWVLGGTRTRRKGEREGGNEQ